MRRGTTIVRVGPGAGAGAGAVCPGRRVLAVLSALVVLVAGCSGGGGAGGGAGGASTTTAPVIRVTTPPTVSVAAPVGSSAARFCAGPLTVTATGTVEDDELDEISGVAASRRNAGVYWVQNDSENPSIVYGIDERGRRRGWVRFASVSVEDWEDLAVGPGPDPAVSYLFVADIGDNALSRANVQIVRVPEPALPATVPAAPPALAADVVTLRYPDRAHNAEAFMVHPTTGDWYLLTKEQNGPSILFRARKPGAGASTIVLEQLTSLSVVPDLVTAADLSPDGSALAVRTYLSVRVYPITGGDVGAALLGPMCRGPLVRDAQGEALAFAADGRSLVTLSEGDHPAVNVIR